MSDVKQILGVWNLQDVSHSKMMWAKFWGFTANAEAYYYIERSSSAKLLDIWEAVSDWSVQAVLSANGNIFVAIYETGGAYVLLYNRDLWWEAMVGGSGTAVEAVKSRLDPLIPRIQPSEDKIPVTFWALGFNGPESHVRMIQAPSWDEISGNYSNRTRERVASLMDVNEPSTGGKLVLLHGKPGTGKTFAIRALGRQWRDWCKVTYVVDPDVFFDRAAYMVHVLLDANDDDEESKKRCNLIIMEDVDEFLTRDAKERSGQAIARLLNVTDGLVGQGLNLVVCVTTNEPIDSLHPAIIRPGRCLAEVEFLPLSRDEALQWAALAPTSSEIRLADIKESMTVADLYGLAGPKPIRMQDTAQAVGFGRR